MHPTVPRACALALLALVACRPTPIGAAVPSPQSILCEGPCRTGVDVEVTYLGVGGVMIRAGDKVLLTAPHFSSPPAPTVVASSVRRGPRIYPDTGLIRRLLPRAAYVASAILVGHGHYDHLLDVPFIADSLARRAIVYGGPSIRNMLLGGRTAAERLVAVEGDSVATVNREGRWITTADGGFRFMALRSNHAPAYLSPLNRFDYAPGTVDTALASLPARAWDWKAGETYAYLIDVLDAAGRPVFRIYYQDTAADAPFGLPPRAFGGRVDLAILCVASARNARPESPDALLVALRPRYVIASHWESFFSPQTEPLRRNPTSLFAEWEASMRQFLEPGAEWSRPMPMDRYRFRAARS